MTGTTISGVYLSTVTLSSAADNPVLVTGAIIPGSGIGLKGLAGTAWSVVNEGTIQSGGSAAVGVALASGGSVSNSAVIIAGTKGTYTNGGTAGIAIYGAAGTVTNSGTIVVYGSAGTGVRLDAGGGVTNSGTIGGYRGASLLAVGVSLGGAGDVANLTGGVMNGVLVTGGAGTVENQGRIHGVSNYGVNLQAGGQVSNAAGGTISGIYIGGTQGSIVNQGYIRANPGKGNVAAGVKLAEGGVVSNAPGGTIFGSGFNSGPIGVELVNGGTLLNQGYVGATNFPFGGQAVLLDSGGVISNATNAVIGSAVTNVSAMGLYAKSSASIATVVNAGTIHGINVTNGIVSNASTGLIDYRFTLFGSTGIVVNAGTLLNGVKVIGGLVNNATGGQIVGQSNSNNSYGLYVGVGTVTNAGTIASGTTLGTKSDALQFSSSGASRLIVHPGAVFRGVVDGGNTIGGGFTSTLELASSATQGTLSGLGSQFIDFAQTTIDTGAAWALTGTSVASNILSVGSTLANNGVLTMDNTVLTDAGVLLNNGTIVLDPSTLTTYSLTGSGMVTMDGSSTFAARGVVSPGQTIDFAGPNALVKISDTIGFAGTMTAFASSDTIELVNFTATGSEYAGGVLTLTSGGGSAELALPGTFTTTDFVVTTGGGNTDVSLVPVCFCAGTHIGTPDGERLIEALAIGDKILMASGVVRPVVWIGTRRIDLSRHPKPHLAAPVRICRGAFGPGLPRRDLLLSPDHSVFAEGVLIPIKYLINGSTVAQERNMLSVWYLHVELATHDIMIADGLAVESYLDVGDRATFDNADVPLVLHPTFNAMRRDSAACAELKLVGPEVDAARARLCYHAGRSVGRAA